MNLLNILGPYKWAEYHKQKLNTYSPYLYNKSKMVIDAINENRQAITALESNPNIQDKYYKHDQGIASTIWNIQHNLNKIPSVTVVDSVNNVVEGQIEYIDTNTLKITFAYAFSGYATCN